MNTITFKAKPYVLWEGDIKRMAINFKKEINKSDTNMRPQDHRYFNSDLFKGILNKTYKQIIGEYRTWAFIDEMPANVTIDTSKFLAVVTVALPESFK